MMHTVRIYTYLPAYPYMICTSTCWSGSKPSQATQTGQFLVSICTYCTYKRTCTIIFNGFDSVEIISLHSWVHWKFQPNYLIKKGFSFLIFHYETSAFHLSELWPLTAILSFLTTNQTAMEAEDCLRSSQARNTSQGIWELEATGTI